MMHMYTPKGKCMSNNNACIENIIPCPDLDSLHNYTVIILVDVTAILWDYAVQLQLSLQYDMFEA